MNLGIQCISLIVLGGALAKLGRYWVHTSEPVFLKATIFSAANT